MSLDVLQQPKSIVLWHQHVSDDGKRASASNHRNRLTGLRDGQRGIADLGQSADENIAHP